MKHFLALELSSEEVCMVITIYCCKKGKCSCCKNSTVVEENEMYGAPQDYDEYDKDNYQTKVIDDNYMYYDS